MPSLIYAIDWMALLLVAAVSIAATVIIAALMSVSNYFFHPPKGEEKASQPRRILGFIFLGLMACVVAFGLYLMIPYFH
ncbi:MAG: hypothetical protein LBG99_04560 [Propionibacteriaceae bacterium]|jgi:K+-sensing histidine kinase KdpD|nr:hypothetical protein [Propionibacteriaceae bacterium]